MFYISPLVRSKTKYRDRIQIYLGLEIDYIQGITGPNHPKFQSLNLDFTIGSVHMMKVDTPFGYTFVDENNDEFKQVNSAIFDGKIERFN